MSTIARLFKIQKNLKHKNSEAWSTLHSLRASYRARYRGAVTKRTRSSFKENRWSEVGQGVNRAVSSSGLRNAPHCFLLTKRQEGLHRGSITWAKTWRTKKKKKWSRWIPRGWQREAALGRGNHVPWPAPQHLHLQPLGSWPSRCFLTASHVLRRCWETRDLKMTQPLQEGTPPASLSFQWNVPR